MIRSPLPLSQAILGRRRGHPVPRPRQGVGRPARLARQRRVAEGARRPAGRAGGADRPRCAGRSQVSPRPGTSTTWPPRAPRRCEAQTPWSPPRPPRTPVELEGRRARPPPRRRRPIALPALARHRGAEPARRGRGGLQAEGLREATGALKDLSLRHHRRAGPQRRHRPLPADATDQPADRGRATCCWSILGPVSRTAPPT